MSSPQMMTMLGFVACAVASTGTTALTARIAASSRITLIRPSMGDRYDTRRLRTPSRSLLYLLRLCFAIRLRSNSEDSQHEHPPAPLPSATSHVLTRQHTICRARLESSGCRRITAGSRLRKQCLPRQSELTQALRGTSKTSAGGMVSISTIGCGGRHMNTVNVILLGVTSMREKPFFSVTLSTSSMPTNCDGFDSILRNEDGKTRSPVPSVPANTTFTGCTSDSSPERT